MDRLPLLVVGLTCCVLVAARTVAAAEVAIVKEGKSEHVVVTPVDPTPAEALAAAEVAAYVERLSGAKLPVEAAKPGQRKSIVVREFGHRLSPEIAEQQAAQPPGTPDDFLIYADGESVVITGASGRGLLHGAYRLLDRLGCRFLAPQFAHYEGSAEVVPHAKTLTATDEAFGNRWISPTFKFRKLYVEEGLSHDEENLRQLVEWMPKVGFNTLVVPTDYQGSGRVRWDAWREALTPELQRRGITIEVGGHGYQNFINAEMPDPDQPGKTLFETHPDWFAKDADGEPQKTKRWVFNTANPDAVRFMVGNVVRYVQERPEIQIFDLWPPDGERWDESEAGKAQGSPADRMVWLTNLVNREVKTVRPDLRLECIAYGQYVVPPTTQRLDKDVLVDFCPINQQFDVPIFDASSEKNADYVKNLTAWRQSFEGDISLYSYYRKYAWRSLPVLIPRYMQQDLQWYAKLPLQGVSTYAEPGDWFTYELNHYALARLAWDPQANVDALVREFAEARYGAKSAEAVGRLYTVLGDAVRTVGSTPHTPMKPADEIDVQRLKLLEAIGQVKAVAYAAQADPARGRNLDRLINLVAEHGVRDLAIQAARAENRPVPEVRAMIDELVTFLAGHRDVGTFIVRGNRPNPSSWYRRYGLTAEGERPEGEGAGD